MNKKEYSELGSASQSFIWGNIILSLIGLFIPIGLSLYNEKLIELDTATEIGLFVAIFINLIGNSFSQIYYRKERDAFIKKTSNDVLDKLRRVSTCFELGNASDTIDYLYKRVATS